MAVFVTSESQARRHGVYAIERTPPATIKKTGTGTVGLIETFPWGPSQTLTFFGDTASMINAMAPPGMDRTGSGYLSLIRKGFARLGIVRVLGTSAAKASANLPNVVPTSIVTVTLKYNGTAGNAVTWTVSNATDGDATHFNLTVTVSGASGVTTDTVQNINVTGSATTLPTAPELARLKLIGAITKLTGGRPINASGTFAGGVDGTINAGAWAGTAGTADVGIALFEANNTIDFVCAGDPGNTLRAGVNAALVAHANLKTDRMAVINGNSGITAAAAQTDVASYRSKRAIYVDVWPYIYDDVDGTKRLVPPGPFAASVGSLLSPSTSIAWKSSEAQTLLSGIVDLEANRGDLAADNTDAGIVTLQREESGGYTFESAKNTNYPVEPSTGSIKRTRMGHYIARSVVTSLRPYTDSPNVSSNQQDEFDAVDGFLSELKANVSKDPNHLPHIVNYSMAQISAINTTDDIQAGRFTIGADITISADQEKIFFSMNFGENVIPSVTI